MKKKQSLHLFYEISVLLLTILFLAVGLFQLGCLLMPERSTYGAVWSSYLQEERNSIDILFLGSSRVYCSVMPARIYENTGVRSYVMAGPSQTASLTYFYLRECLKTQTPQYVFVEASCAYSGLTEADSLANVCYMPFSINRILAAANCESGILKLALFPLEEFHSRIYTPGHSRSVEQEGILLCGYTPLAKTQSQKDRSIFSTAAAPGDAVYETNLSFLKKIAALCESKGIRCIFFLAPAFTPLSDEARERLTLDLSALPCDAVEDWEDLNDAIGIDPEKDWYDAIHFGTTGAVKFSDHLSGYIDNLALLPSQNPVLALWAQRIEYMHALLS